MMPQAFESMAVRPYWWDRPFWWDRVVKMDPDFCERISFNDDLKSGLQLTKTVYVVITVPQIVPQSSSTGVAISLHECLFNNGSLHGLGEGFYQCGDSERTCFAAEQNYDHVNYSAGVTNEVFQSACFLDSAMCGAHPGYNTAPIILSRGGLRTTQW